MRGGGGSSSSVETVTAAANAIIAAESRVQQVTVPRRRWGSCFSVYWCFGSQKRTNRINHAALVPEPMPAGPQATVSENTNHPPPLTLPFIAPPSSPASFLNSEPSSSTQSPAAFLSLSSISANSYSPSGPSSIFAVGPYANETQLVSPPVFSTFTTEPNTAPFTPPPETIQLTTPSSPEVPFARLLSSFDSNCKKREAYEFPSYQLYPGSPIGHLISPSSVSGTSSPFPDPEFYSSAGGPSKITAEGLPECNIVPRCISLGHSSILDRQISAVVPASDESRSSLRLSFQLTADEVAQCMERKPAIPVEAARGYPYDKTGAVSSRDYLATEAESGGGSLANETSHDVPEKLPTSGELMAGKEFKFDNSEESTHTSPEKLPSSGELVAAREFKFDNSDGVMAEPSVASDWWVNEKVVVANTAPPKKWTFFPMVQAGFS
ncbi:hydroxyproline-rich glycoprotein family protein isoform X1 [Iris pallida]|uniref:Hydroxyproline-rich glycoprotein family protein isoform X1 n=1 Tax=Iris pallida TaxID=29817 RepID=A0AAX6IF91_IRIPA|nr:hydroxyproline-rich glycoprotein family protein isoform X1 [Iris pallida]